MATSRQATLTGARLRRENRRYRGSGGRSQENRSAGFFPAFRDRETGRAELSRFADGSPAPLHLLDGLPDAWVLERDRAGKVVACKSSVIAGFLPGPGLAVYHASKAYVISFAEALHQELKGEGVRVCALCPGPVDTEFFDRGGLPRDYFPSYLNRSAERVAREGYVGFMAGHRVVVPGRSNRVVTLLPRLLPSGLMLAITGRQWKKINRGD